MLKLVSFHVILSFLKIYTKLYIELNKFHKSAKAVWTTYFFWQNPLLQNIPFSESIQGISKINLNYSERCTINANDSVRDKIVTFNIFWNPKFSICIHCLHKHNNLNNYLFHNWKKLIVALNNLGGKCSVHFFLF